LRNSIRKPGELKNCFPIANILQEHSAIKIEDYTSLVNARTNSSPPRMAGETIIAKSSVEAFLKD